MKINAEEGNLITLVFKAAPFAPAPDPATGQITMQLNYFKGIYRGYEDDSTFRLESPGGERNITWHIADGEIAMWCDMGRVEIASTVS